MAQEPFIICDNVVKIYKVADLETVALQGLDLVVAPGELVSLVGPSGSGKSTLMNILGGLDRPSAGRVWVDGDDLLKMSDAALNRYRRSKVGFVWQQVSRNLVPYLNALENVELPMTLAGQTERRKRRRAEELLEAVGLAERRHHHLGQLSGGEQQRVAIAVALANTPRLLLADEPTGEVDSATALTIYEAFQRLNREYGLTTLIVSHDPGITRHVDRVVAISDGKIATETVRQSASINGADSGLSPSEIDLRAEDDVFQELVVLDSAGRLQVPKEYLEHFDIGLRALLDLTEEGILIRPAPQSDSRNAETAAADLAPGPKKRAGLLGLQSPAGLRRTLSTSRAFELLGRLVHRRPGTRDEGKQ